MSLKSVKTLTAAQIAKKWKLSRQTVSSLIDDGAKVEHEHDKSMKNAKEIARDHISERPDYYKKLRKMEKSKISMKEGLSTEPERDTAPIGDYTGSSRKVMKVDEVKVPPKVKKAVAVGMTAANIATGADIYDRASRGVGSPIKDVAAAASGLPGKVGYAAMGTNWTVKGFDKAREHIRARQAKKMEEQGSPANPARYTERPMYEEDTMKNAEDKIKAAFTADKVKGMFKKVDKQRDKDPKWQAYKKRKQLKEEDYDLDRVLAAFRKNETGSYEGNYAAKGRPGRSASGAYQYIDKTWKAVTKSLGIGSQYAHASDAPKDVQDAVKAGELKKAGSLQKAVNIHYTGNPAGKMTGKQLRANKGQTASTYYSNFQKNMSGYTPAGKAQTSSTPEPAKAPETPAPAAVKPTSNFKVSAASSTDRTSASATPRTPSTSVTPSMPSSTTTGSYSVQKDDTLSSIAKRYNTDVGTLAKSSNISNPDRISPGQSINVGSSSPTTPSAEKIKAAVREAVMAMPPSIQPPAVHGPQVPGIKRQAPREMSGRATGRMTGPSGSMSAKPTVTRTFSRPGTATFGQVGAGPSTSVRPTKVTASVSQGGGQIAQKMARSAPSQMITKMSDIGRQAAIKAAPVASKVAGTALRAVGGPAATAAAAVMSPTPAGAGEDEKKRQETLKSYNPYKAQGRSVSDYEKQALTPQKYDQPKTQAAKTKVDAPTPTSRPDYFTRGQAFQAARGEAGGSGGKFSYGGSEYQTNVKGEPYAAKPKQTSVSDIKEETTMDTKELINEALDDILENNLVSMKENLMTALQEKAMEKLEEKKRDIAANYFAQ